VLAGREQHAERAIRLVGARPPVAIVQEYERTAAEGCAALGETAFSDAWADGRAMSLEQAVEYVHSGG
jgi:hypothetical protein